MKNGLIFLFLAFGTIVSAQIIDFPDANFKNALVNTKCVDTDGDGSGDTDADSNNDGEIEVDEAVNVTILNVESKQISRLDGIEHFKNLREFSCGKNHLSYLSTDFWPNLTYLNCYQNNINQIKIDKSKQLRTLSCRENLLETLDLSNNKSLRFLTCSFNQLKEINLNGLSNLNYLYCESNQLTSLNLDYLVTLTHLSCSDNNLKRLDLEKLENLLLLNCGENQLKELFLDNLVNLRSLECEKNSIIHLNLNFLKDLEDLFCSSNNIETLNTCNLKKIRRLRCDSAKLENLIIDTDQNLDFSFNNNPNLKYICCNPELVEMISDSVVSYGLNNCEIDSICCISNNVNFTVSNTNIYPNPVRDILHISTEETWTKAEIYDIAGKIIRSFTPDSQSIDVSGLESGTYFIRLKQGEKVGRVKFVKI